MPNVPFPFVGALDDSTSIPIFHLYVHFKEVKIYYDGKNRMYALKKEMIVLHVPLHYAIFLSKGVIRSAHDYHIHKENFINYILYLLKELTEVKAILIDQTFELWALLLDSSYIGPAEDMPHL